jgi:hypothetical protein
MRYHIHFHLLVMKSQFDIYFKENANEWPRGTL